MLSGSFSRRFRKGGYMKRLIWEIFGLLTIYGILLFGLENWNYWVKLIGLMIFIIAHGFVRYIEGQRSMEKYL